jgi:hypothetical protein
MFSLPTTHNKEKVNTENNKLACQPSLPVRVSNATSTSATVNPSVSQYESSPAPILAWKDLMHGPSHLQ